MLWGKDITPHFMTDHKVHQDNVFVAPYLILLGSNSILLTGKAVGTDKTHNKTSTIVRVGLVLIAKLIEPFP